MRKRVILLLIVCINVFMLTGCWNYVEINQQMNASGIAIDVGQQGKKYHLSIEVISVGMKAEEGISANVLETDSDTLFEGIRDLMAMTTKKLYFGHCKTMIIGEKAAKNGIAEIIDVTLRNHEVRKELDIAISKGCDAKDILLTEGIATPIMSYKIYDLMNTSVKAVGGAPKTKAYLIFNSIQSEGVCTVIPALQIGNVQEKKVLELAGVAVFDNDKLAGFLDKRETEYLSFLNNKIERSGLLTVKVSENPDLFLSYEVYKSKTKRDLQFNEDVPSVNITVNTSAIIGEVETEEDFSKPEEVEKVKQLLAKNMEENFTKLIDRAQTKLNCDIFGIGAQLQRDNPEMWGKYKDNWDGTFKKVKINVDCKVKITGSGIENGTVKKGQLK